MVPPFTATVVKETPDVYYPSNITKDTYVFNVMPNGKYTGTYESVSDGVQPETSEISGIWKTTSREVGDNYQKVYDIRVTGTSFPGSFYLPDDGEYVWYDDFESCSNLNTKKVLKVTIEKK